MTRRRLLAGGSAAALLVAGAGVAGAWPVLDDGGIGGAALVPPTPAEPAALVPEAPAAPPSAVSEPAPAAAPAAAQEAAAPATLAFSEVARVEPWDGLLFLAGRLRGYAGASIESIMGFSPADLLETMDTVVLDSVLANRGSAALATVYRVIATETLEALLATYGERPLVLALDAGHGGRPGVFYDPGSNGTEAQHTRRTVEAIEARAADPRYASITIRRLFNDAIGDDFGLPPPEDRKGAAALTMRLIRGAMLAQEAAAWNRANPDAAVTLHMLSVHYNAGSGGILVLHQGSSVAREYQQRSIAYASAYVASARAALNRTGLLPYALSYALGTGLSDDRLLYERAFNASSFNPYTGVDRRAFPRRYAMLQSSLLQRDYAHGALIYHGLA